MPCTGKTVAVFSMLDDKDIDGTVAIMRPVIDSWYLAPLTCKRAASLDKLKNIFAAAGITSVHTSASIAAAYRLARERASTGDRIIIFGSFYTVSEIMRVMPN
jgi:dihydrofolate synthase/folylpolyglutamate synthase